MRHAVFATFFAAVFSLFLLPAPAQAVDKFVTLGTAGVTGVYYPAGGAICRFVNRDRKQHNIRCSVESTNGSIDNLTRIAQNDLDFGIVQSDWQFHAYNGTGVFADQTPNHHLRSVFSLHSEAFTVLVRKDSGINTFAGLQGKRVNIGNAGSGMHGTMEQVMKEMGWTNATFKAVTDFKPAESAEALCSGKTDALVYSGGHPNGAVQEITMSCPVTILNVEGPAIDALIKKNPFYAYATIPGGMYPGNAEAVKTFGVKATLVTSDAVDDDIVYQFTRSVFDNLEAMKTLHPVLSTLDAAQMVADSNTAPIHPGALRYFKEKGLISASAVTEKPPAVANSTVH